MARHARHIKQEMQRGASPVRNVLFTLTLCLAMLGPFALWLTCKVGVELPTWATAEDAKYLSGAVKNPDVVGSMSMEGFANRRLQGALEDAVGNFIPAKAKALLGNAALQRGSIRASNALFGYPCYPTFYGSDSLYLPDADALSIMPSLMNESYREGMTHFAQGVSAVAVRHPQTRFVVFSVPGHRSPSALPAYGLVSDPVTDRNSFDILLNGLGNAPNVFAATLAYDTPQDYYQEFFRTDHHWKICGAVAAYNQIANNLGLDPLVNVAYKSVDGYVFNGSRTRTALDMVGEPVSDIDRDFSAIEVREPGNDPYPYGHTYFYTDTGPGNQFRFHDSYYDFLPSGTSLINTGTATIPCKALVITDSFGCDIEPLLAQQYEQVDVIFDLASNGLWEKAASFEAALDGGAYGDVYIIGSPYDMVVLANDVQGYFDEPESLD